MILVLLLSCATEEPADPELHTFWADWDGDGYGDPWSDHAAPHAPKGYVDNDRDCDDTRADVSPDADETCNGRDDDCDEEVDEDVVATFFADADADGAGDPDREIEACEAPDGWVADASDCDDGDGDVFPGAEEVCGDGVDQDCDASDCGVTVSGDWTIRLTGSTDSSALGRAGGIDIGLGHASLLVLERRIYRFDGLDPSDVDTSGYDDVAPEDLSYFRVLGDLNGDGVQDVWVYVPAEYSGALISGADLGAERFATTDLTPPTGYMPLDGDLDGDGQSDLLTVSYDDSYVAWAHLGPVSGTVTPDDAWASWTTERCHDRWGRATMVDLDGDGADEVLFADFRCDEEGRLEVFRFDGGSGGARTTEDAGAEHATTVLPDEASYTWGAQVHAVGDVDGDGLEDAAILARYAGGTEGLSGTAWLLAGDTPAGTDLSDVAARWEGVWRWDGAGAAVTSGDFDGDGQLDLAVGAPSYPRGAEYGAVAVQWGPIEPGVRTLHDADWLWVSEDWGTNAGAVLTAGDVDADGIDDLVVGGVNWPENEGYGAIWVLGAGVMR